MFGAEEERHDAGQDIAGWIESAPVIPLGIVNLPMKKGTIITPVEFFVKDVPSLYNLIVGRGFIYDLGAIASTCHQVIRYPREKGVEEIWGDQVAAKECFIAAIKSKAKIKEV